MGDDDRCGKTDQRADLGGVNDVFFISDCTSCRLRCSASASFRQST